jgi:hypothetical protein
LKAAEEFKAAFEITKDPIVLYNVGEAYAKAQHYEEAIRAFEGYLVGAPSAKDREEVQRKIVELRKKQRATPAPPPPVVTPPTPVAPPAPAPAPEPTPVPESPYGVAPEGSYPEGAAVTPVPPAAPPSQRGSSGLRLAAWIGVGLTAALLTTSAMMALSAQSREDDLRRAQEFIDPRTGQPLEFSGSIKSDYEQNLSDGQSYKDLSLIFLLVSGAAAAGTATLFILDHYQNGSAAKAGTGLRLSGGASPQGASVRLGWSF